jgi:hypothetical protein
MRRDFKRFETELVKAKQILHGKKQSSFNDSRIRRTENNDRMRGSIYEKSRKSRRKRKEMGIMGKTKRGLSKGKDFDKYRIQHSILGEKMARERESVKGWKRMRTARTMEKRRGGNHYVPKNNEFQFSSRNIPKLPKISKEMMMSQNMKKGKPKRDENWGKKMKDIKLEDLYAKNPRKKVRNRSKTPGRKIRKSNLGSKKNPLPKMPQMSADELRKGSFLTATIKEKKRGIVNTRKIPNIKEKMKTKQSFQELHIARENEMQNSVGPYHSSKTDNSPKKMDLKPKIMLKFAVVNGLENGREKTGQDAVLVYKFKVNGEQFHVFGVFDGHGKHGHHVSLFLKKNLVSVLKKEIIEFREIKDIKEILEGAVKILHRQILDITKKFQQNFSNK